MWLIPAVSNCRLCPWLWAGLKGRALTSHLWWRDHGHLWELEQGTQLCIDVPWARVLWSSLPPPKHWNLQSLKSLLLASCCRLGSHQIGSAAPVPPSPVGTWVLLPPCKPWCAPSSSLPATYGPVCWCCCLATTVWWTAWREAMIKQPELASESRDRCCNVTSSDSWDSNTFRVLIPKKNENQ